MVEKMINKTLMATLALLLALTASVCADVGKVVRVVDGDTFLAEIQGKKGTETIKVNLRCSDAPVLDSPFGREAKEELERLLKRPGLVTYKILEYCGSQQCVEALAYFPPEEDAEIVYLNTLMIAAGMARNSDCRGDFSAAEQKAKADERGIWSTAKKIVFTETTRKEEPSPEPARKVVREQEPVQEEAPAIIRYDRVERTVTMKSRKISLTRAIEIIDSVSPTPINLYLKKQHYLPINLDRTYWYDALRYIVETADLKQVNLDGKIDLYTRLFYYKHVSPYLKVSGNVGVYMNAGDSAPDEPTQDDGETRYVFINDFENSAEVARQYRQAKAKNQESGFIQVHQGSGAAPVSNYGTFERSDSSEPADQVAAVPDEIAEPEEPVRPALKPYSGKKPVDETREESIKVAAVQVKETDEPPVAEEKDTPAAAEPAGQTVEPKSEPAPEPEEQTVAVAPPSEPKEKDGAGSKIASTPEGGADNAEASVQKRTESSAAPKQAPAFSFNPLHVIVIVVILAVVIVGSVFLTRSAGSRAAKAEMHVELEELLQKEEPDLKAESQVDKDYEEELFSELDHASDSESAAAGQPDEMSSDHEQEITADKDAASSAGLEDKAAAQETVAKDAVSEAPEPVEEVEDTDEERIAADGSIKGPLREPRKICLFEVKCNLDGESFTGIGLDISGGGLFIDSKQHLEIGTVLDLDFKLFEDQDEAIRCRGAVTWYNRRPDPIKPDYPNGFGVRFIDMDATTIMRIEDYLSSAETKT